MLEVVKEMSQDDINYITLDDIPRHKITNDVIRLHKMIISKRTSGVSNSITHSTG